VRLLVHRGADAVAAKPVRHPVPESAGDGLDRVGDVAQPRTGPGRRDAGGEGGVGGLDESDRVGVEVTDADGHGRVAVVPVHICAAVDGEQVAGAQRAAVRDAVHDRVVDRQAEHAGVRAGCPRRVVPEERRLGAGGRDPVGGELVEVLQSGSGPCGRDNLGDGTGDDASGLPQCGHLRGRSQHNHGWYCNTRIIISVMVRTPLTEDERVRGAALGRALQVARGRRSAAEVALEAGISLDTLRKIERGAIATPAFFTVAALARVLEVDLVDLASVADATGRDAQVA
jgi:Helix-turn-helix domain